MHVLEAGYETTGRPCVLLLHGFPELAYSWRKVMPRAGGGRLSRDRAGPARLRPHHRLGRQLRRRSRAFRLLNLVRDALGLVPRSATQASMRWSATISALGRGLVRAGAARRLPLGGADERAVRRPAAVAVRHRRRTAATRREIHAPRLAALPRPRKHYQWYYSTRAGQRRHVARAPQGVHDFLRAYYHHKSADWKANKPYPLKGWIGERAGQDCRPTTSWISPSGMAETVAEEMPSMRARSPPTSGCRTASFRSTATNMRAPASRAACNGIAAAPAARSAASSQVCPAAPSTCRRCFISGKQRLGHLPAPGAIEAMQQERLHAHARRSPDRRRRPLGAAGTARARSTACCCSS